MREQTALMLIAIASVLAGMTGLWLGSDSTSYAYQSQSIEHGCAAYDSRTGEWGWLPKEPRP